MGCRTRYISSVRGVEKVLDEMGRLDGKLASFADLMGINKVARMLRFVGLYQNR